MKKFQYQVLRYMPDRVSGEFINLGIVLLALEKNRLYFRLYSKTRRLHDFFPDINSLFVKQSVKKIEAGLAQLQRLFDPSFFTESTDNVERLTSQILPKDDSALFFSEHKTVLDLDGETLVNELFERMVINHVVDEEKNSIQDSEVWSKIYKPYFEKASFASSLKETTIKTKYSELHFDKTIENGVLHCFEPVSFQLTTNDIIHRKAWTWSGRLQELESASEEMNVYLLAALPSDKKMKDLLKNKFDNKKIGKATLRLIDERHAAQLVQEVEVLVKDHNV